MEGFTFTFTFIGGDFHYCTQFAWPLNLQEPPLIDLPNKVRSI